MELKTRNMVSAPYSLDEARVAKYLVDLTGIGGGDDPIGFLIASHRVLSGVVSEHPNVFTMMTLPIGEGDERDEEYIDCVKSANAEDVICAKGSRSCTKHPPENPWDGYHLFPRDL